MLVGRGSLCWLVGMRWGDNTERLKIYMRGAWWVNVLNFGLGSDRFFIVKPVLCYSKTDYSDTVYNKTGYISDQYKLKVLASLDWNLEPLTGRELNAADLEWDGMEQAWRWGEAASIQLWGEAAMRWGNNKTAWLVMASVEMTRQQQVEFSLWFITKWKI